MNGVYADARSVNGARASLCPVSPPPTILLIPICDTVDFGITIAVCFGPAAHARGVQSCTVQAWSSGAMAPPSVALLTSSLAPYRLSRARAASIASRCWGLVAWPFHVDRAKRPLLSHDTTRSQAEVEPAKRGVYSALGGRCQCGFRRGMRLGSAAGPVCRRAALLKMLPSGHTVGLGHRESSHLCLQSGS